MDTDQRILGLRFHPREVMAASLGKQRELNEQIKPVSLKEALEPYHQDTGVDFYSFYQKKYDVKPRHGEQESVRTDVEDIKDLSQYFIKQEGRRFYRYIDSRFNPTRKSDELQDFVIMEEDTPSGIVLAVFRYPGKPKPTPIYIGLQPKDIYSLKLLGCFAVKKTDDSRTADQAIDLTGYWLKRNRQLKRKEDKVGAISHVFPDRLSNDQTLPDAESMQVDLIGLVPKSQHLTSEEQLNILKSEGCLFFRDSNQKDKWLDLSLAGAAFSQDEGDKTISTDRTRSMLGVVRLLLGELYTSEKIQVNHMLATGGILGHGDPIPQAIKESRDWIRNRMAVALYSILYLHKLGFDIVPVSEYGNYIRKVESILGAKYEAENRFQTANVKLQSERKPIASVT